MSDFSIQACPLVGLALLERRCIEDHRGFFSRLYCAQELHHAGFDGPVAQINQSYTRLRGSVRGLHYQEVPHAEVKFVSVLRGVIFDVAVDLRRGSPTFLQWHGETLSRDNRRSMLIPRGFAHGFQALTDDCELIYMHSTSYVPASERGLHARDPLLNIPWPLEISDLSARDAAHALLGPGFTGVSL